MAMALNFNHWSPFHNRVRDFTLKHQNYTYCKEIIRTMSEYDKKSLDVFDCFNNLLFYSFRANNLPIMKMLLEFGADPCVAYFNGTNLLHVISTVDEFSVEFPDFEVTQHLLVLYATMKDNEKKKAFVNATDHMGITPLMAAAKINNYHMVLWLLANGAKIDGKRSGGWTAAHDAARMGYVETLHVLLLNGADPKIQGMEEKFLNVRDVAEGKKRINKLLDSFVS